MAKDDYFKRAERRKGNGRDCAGIAPVGLTTGTMSDVLQYSTSTRPTYRGRATNKRGRHFEEVPYRKGSTY
jgi:hypothetical protein